VWPGELSKNGELCPQFHDRRQKAVFYLRADLPRTPAKGEKVLRNDNIENILFVNPSQ
jgi:hypothetical protein